MSTWGEHRLSFHQTLSSLWMLLLACPNATYGLHRLLWSLSFLRIFSCEPHSSEYCPQIISFSLYIEETHPFHLRYFHYAHPVSNRSHSTNCTLTNPVLFSQTHPFCLIFFIAYSLEYLLSGSSCLYTSFLSHLLSRAWLHGWQNK